MNLLLAIVLIALNAADIVTTNRFLKNGSAVEGNPVVAWLQAKLGAAWMIVKFGVVYLIALAGAFSQHWLVTAALAIVLFAQAVVVGSNIRIIQNRK